MVLINEARRYSTNNYIANRYRHVLLNCHFAWLEARPVVMRSARRGFVKASTAQDNQIRCLRKKLFPTITNKNHMHFC